MRKNIRAGVLVCAAAWALGAGVAFAAPAAPPGFEVNTVVSGLTLPTAFAFAPDGRIFIAEKSGTILEVKNGILQPTPVAELPDVNDYDDRGVEGIAVDPNFSQNGYIYVAYTYENTPGQDYTGPKTGRIVRLTVVGDTASLASKVVILGTVGGDAAHPSCMDFATTSDCIPSDSNTHSMGVLRFGPDGKLYASLGDGEGYVTADPKALDAQDLNSLGGKIVRINTDGTAPSDNPFYDGNPNNNRSKVWALGNRNMYRFTFRPSDGKMFIGAVGWATWESIYIGKPGANYGWPCLEGFATTTYDCTPSSPPTYPIYVYDHSAGSAAVIGGAFPTAYPAPYAGDYFFGDYPQDFIKRMVLNPNDTVASVDDFVTNAGGPVDIETGPDGNLWYLALNVGQLREIVHSTANQPPSATVDAAPTQGPAPLTVDFSGTGSSDPDGDALSYAWDFGDGSTGEGATVSHTYAADGSYTATLTVTDSAGLTSKAIALVTVGSVQSGVPAPHEVTTAISPAPVILGQQETVTTTVSNAGDGTAPFLVDMEIYDSSMHQVAQKIFENVTIPTGSSSDFSMQWLPPAAGDYTVKVGLFKQGWAGMYEWTDDALPVTVLGSVPSGTPSFTQSTTADPHPAVGGGDTITTAVTDTGAAAQALIDLEVYQNGVKVGQEFFDNQSFDAGQSRQYSYAFTVPDPGAYQVSVGVFAPAWSSLYSWFNGAAAFDAGSSPAVAYADALSPGWENWSWGSGVNLADTSQAYEGSDSIRVTYTSPWGGLFLHDDAPVDTADKSALVFAIAGAGASGQNVQLYLFDGSGNKLPTVNLAPYIPGGIVAGVWKIVRIPLSDLGAQGKTVGGIILQDASGAPGQSVNVDSVELQ